MIITKKTKRKILFSGHTSGASLQAKMRQFEAFLAESREVIKLVFEKAFGGEDTAGSLRFAHTIRSARVTTESWAYGELNSSSLLISTSAKVAYIEAGCTCLIHPVNLPRNLPVTLLNEEENLPAAITHGALRLHDEYRRMLVANSKGKLSFAKLDEIMSRNHGRGDIIDASEAVCLGIADYMFAKRRAKT